MPYAVITGVSQGIGKVIAEHLLEQGFSIAGCARNAEALKVLQQLWQLQYPGADIMLEPADLSLKEDAMSFANLATGRLPAVDILVNNAGMYQPGTVAEEADGLLERMIAINLYSAYRVTRQVLPIMKQCSKGHIFNICSIASLKAYPNGGSYSISKYALLGFSDNLREELKETGIRVTAICPGATFSPSWDGSGVDPARIMEATDIAKMLWASYQLSSQANVEHIVMRPVKGDL